MINWTSLLDKCKNYERIVVSGPQRSGTTYTAKELARSLSYLYIDEGDFKNSLYDLFLQKLSNPKVVVQAPGITHELEQINLDNTLVIWMCRDFKDIEKSEDRINWHPFEANQEFKKYINKFTNLINIIKEFDRSAPMKTFIFKNFQKDQMKVDWIYVNYSILNTSPNYVDHNIRKDFKPKQTK